MPVLLVLADGAIAIENGPLDGLGLCFFFLTNMPPIKRSDSGCCRSLVLGLGLCVLCLSCARQLYYVPYPYHIQQGGYRIARATRGGWLELEGFHLLIVKK